MSESLLPYGRQSIDEDDIRAVVDVLRSDYLTTGPAIDGFEAGLNAATGARRAVAVNSGTSALHAMYFGMGLLAGDEIVTSPLTFAGTANAALYRGASVRFADIDPATGNIDPASVDDLITSRTRLIVAVDYAGLPADYDNLQRVADARDVPLVADAAHSLGATYRGRPVGMLARASALSFHPVKPITTGEGGAVVTDDDTVADRAARFRTHGITRDRALMETDDGPWYYEMVDLGFNYRMTDLQAALGLSQLSHLSAFVERRRAIAARYDEELATIPGLILPATPNGIMPGWHLYVVRVDGNPERRRPFFERLRALGLGVQVHYIPVYWHPYYRDLGFGRGACPAAEDFYSRAVSLPIFPRMSDPDIDRVIAGVRRAASEVL